LSEFAEIWYMSSLSILRHSGSRIVKMYFRSNPRWRTARKLRPDWNFDLTSGLAQRPPTKSMSQIMPQAHLEIHTQTLRLGYLLPKLLQGRGGGDKSDFRP